MFKNVFQIALVWLLAVKYTIYKTFIDTHICKPLSASLFIGYFYIIHIPKAQVL